MKKPFLLIVLLAALMLACSVSGTATPAPNTETATVPSPAIVTNVTCNELALYLDPALASGYDCQTVPGTSGEGPEVYPEHTELTLQGYVLADRFFPAHIDVYPVQGYAALDPDAVNSRVAALQALIGGGSTGDSALPFLPGFNAAQEFHAQYHVGSFASGDGIRFLTQYSQFADPINNKEMFYTFQGLTADGSYWVSVVLPISNSILPENSDNPPGGMTWDQFTSNFDSYMLDITTQLNAQPAGSFLPTIDALDALAASITIQP